jgi:hypothetical protein
MREDRRVLRWRRLLACLLAAATAATALTAAGFAAFSDSPDLSPWAVPPFLAAILVPAGVGLFVALRRPGNAVAWILLGGPLSVAVVMAASAVANATLPGDPDSTLGAWAAVVAQEWPVIFLWPLGLAYVFPDGRLPSRRWRPAAALAALSAAGP